MQDTTGVSVLGGGYFRKIATRFAAIRRAHRRARAARRRSLELAILGNLGPRDLAALGITPAELEAELARLRRAG